MEPILKGRSWSIYRKLFSCNSPQSPGFEEDFLSLMPKVDDIDREFLEEPITLSELERAIDDLKSGKSPGPDGLTALFL